MGVATSLENSVGAGVIEPGETLVLIGGFYARIRNRWLRAYLFLGSFVPVV